MPTSSQTGTKATSALPGTVNSGSFASGAVRATGDFRSRNPPPNARTIKNPPRTGTITRAAARDAVHAIMQTRA